MFALKKLLNVTCYPIIMGSACQLFFYVLCVCVFFIIIIIINLQISKNIYLPPKIFTCVYYDTLFIIIIATIINIHSFIHIYFTQLKNILQILQILTNKYIYIKDTRINKGKYTHTHTHTHTHKYEKQKYDC